MAKSAMAGACSRLSHHFPMSALVLFLSDVERWYGNRFGARALVGAVINPSLRACFVVRMAQTAPRWFHWFWRSCLIQGFAIDIGRGVAIGAGLSLPHPTGIVFGSGTAIASGVTIYQNVTLGRGKGGYPSIGRGVTLLPGCIVVGEVEVGEDAVIGALCFVDYSVQRAVTVSRRA